MKSSPISFRARPNIFGTRGTNVNFDQFQINYWSEDLVFMYFGVFIKHGKSALMGDSYVTCLCLQFLCKAALHIITSTRPIYLQETQNHYNHLLFPIPMLDGGGLNLL
jgi:hypothetical protein